MPECSYCEESFEDEDAYLDHLADEHEGELSAIDRRRIDGRQGDGGGIPTGPLVLGVVLGVALLLVVYVTFFLGGGSNIGPVGSTHEHGTINVTIAGQTIDFSEDRYQRQDRKFHFEAGTEVWHKHATGVTLEYAMETVGIEITENSVTVRGTTYRESDPGTEIVLEVNGKPVGPGYVLQGVPPDVDPSEGDHIRIVVRTNGS